MHSLKYTDVSQNVLNIIDKISKPIIYNIRVVVHIL